MSELILTVDVGNTSTSCGVWDIEGGLLALFSFRTTQVVSCEELLIKLKTLLSLYNISLHNIKGLSVACVVPPLEDYWVEIGKRWLAREVILASCETVPIKIDLHYPAEVGADRIVNAFAGWKKFGRSLIIVDFGTAITFDCVSSEGVYLGGAIAPGLFLSMEALFKGTAKLPKVDLAITPKKALGKDTVSALKSGLIYGFAGLTDSLVERLSEEMISSPIVVATGGLANYIAPHSRTIALVDPTLTLEGLLFLWKHYH